MNAATIIGAILTGVGFALFIYGGTEPPAAAPEVDDQPWSTTDPTPPRFGCRICRGSGEEIIADRPYPCRACALELEVVP